MYSDVDSLRSDLSMARSPRPVRPAYRYERSPSDGGNARILLATDVGHAAMDVRYRLGGTSVGSGQGNSLELCLFVIAEIQVGLLQRALWV